MSREQECIKAIQYLLDEGFIVAGLKDGEPALFLTTNLSKAQKAIRVKVNDPADYWKNEKKE